MNARKMPDGKGRSNDNAKARSSAVAKIERREARQDARTGKVGKPVRAVGRTIQDGFTGGA